MLFQNGLQITKIGIESKIKLRQIRGVTSQTSKDAGLTLGALLPTWAHFGIIANA